jgi:uncharacterized membrane protein
MAADRMSTLANTVRQSAPGIHAGAGRLESIDMVRGIVMVLMALDHVRDFFGIPGISPTDVTRASAALFLTRWITNICAPGFFLLMGTGAYLSLRKRSRPELAQFLVIRGIWLIFVDVVLMRCLGMQFNFDYHVTMLIVLWALGWAMIALAAMLALPTRWIGVIGIIMIAAHNLLDRVQSSNPLWLILHRPGVVLNRPGHLIFVAYPLIPWIGVTAAGFALGQLYEWPEQKRKTWLTRLGIALIAGFLILRAINIYGDPLPWSRQPSFSHTILSFLNTVKYPPSLLFLLMTLGPILLLLRVFENGTPRGLRPVNVFGRVPMSYYLLHIPLIHLLAVALCYLQHGTAHWMFESPTIANYPFTAPPGWGLTLPETYLVWVLVVALLYPVCRWIAGVKQRHRNAWLSYL